jgi:hypothetical protein
MMIFTEEIALSLLELGFKLEYRTKLAWCFEDSELLAHTVNGLLAALD